MVIGASQAGFAMGYHLAQKGLSFVILDAGPEIGHLWRSRWDSLVLFTPAKYSGLPGMAFPAPENTYPSRDDVVSYLQAYSATFDLPVRLNSRVTSLTKGDNGYVVATSEETWEARQVVVATGPFQVAFTPRLRRVRRIRVSDPQRRLSQSGSDSRGASPGRGGRQLRLSDRRGVDGNQGS